jgi:hypothetical protein
MSAIFFAVFLTILQTAPPAPRQTIKDHGEKAETKTQISKDSQKPAAPLPSETAINAPTKEDSATKSANNKAQDRDQAAKKYEPWTRADKLSLAYDILTGLLVIIGGFGVCFAIRTLRAIEGQTNVLAESQRPRIVADAAEHPWQTFFADSSRRRVVLRVTNKGLTPATDYRYESWIEVRPDTTGDFTDEADYVKCGVVSVLYPDSPQNINVPLRNDVTDQEAFEIRKLRKYVCVRVRLHYRDPFVPSRHWFADSGFFVEPRGLGFLDKHNGVGYEDKKA